MFLLIKLDDIDDRRYITSTFQRNEMIKDRKSAR